MSDQDPDDEAPPDDPLRKKLDALLPAEAFEPIARALGKSTERRNLETLREWLREYFYWFYSSYTADRSTQAKWERERTRLHNAAATLLLSLQSASILDKPRVLLDEDFHEKFIRVLKTLAQPPRRRGRHRPNNAFRHDLAPGLIWVYEHITGEKAGKPHWLRHSRAYGGDFYRFACAIRNCLYDRVLEVRAGLPATDEALGQELKDHWPEPV